MAVKETSLKLLLNPSGFISGIRRMTSMVQSAGLKMGSALKEPMRKGISAAGTELNSMLGELKTGLKTAATLGGAVSFGAMIKGAMDADAAYAQLSATVSNLSDRNVTAAEIQNVVEQAAEESADSIENLQIMANQLATVGDISILGESLEMASKQAKRLGVEGQLVARTYSRLIAKGLAESAEEAMVLTEQMNKFGRVVLGIDPDEAIDPVDIAEYASFVNTMNSNIGETNALLSMTGGAAKDFGQAIEVLEELGEFLQTRKGLSEIRKITRLSKNDINLTKDAIENMLIVLEKKGPKGFKKFQDVFGPRVRVALREIVGEDLVKAAETGKVTKEDWNLRVAELRKELKAAANAGVDMAQIAKADAAIRKTTAANFQTAMNEISKAFADEKMIGAIRTMSEHLPTLAKKLSEFLSWVMENPKTAAATLVLGRVALAFGGAAIQNAAATGLTSLFKVISTKIGVGGLAALAGKVAAGAGTIATGTMALGAAGVGAAGAVGGAAGYYIGFKGAIEPGLKENFGALQKIDESLIDVSSALAKKEGLEQKRAALKEVKAHLTMVREGPGAAAKATGAMVELFTRGEVKGATTKYKRREDELIRAQILLEKSIKTLGESMDKVSGAANGAGDNLNKMGGIIKPGITRGPAKELETKAGATPTRG